MKTNKLNPYADENGHPKTGMMHKFFNWQSDLEDQKRIELSSEQLRELKVNDKHLQDKMNS